jgi:hypothetical protein
MEVYQVISSFKHCILQGSNLQKYAANTVLYSEKNLNSASNEYTHWHKNMIPAKMF